MRCQLNLRVPGDCAGRGRASMTLLVLAYLGGVLTIISPCILPVLPFVFARADRPFLRNGLPMLVGMALTFAVVATLRGRRRRLGGRGQPVWPIAALALMAAFGLTLLFPQSGRSRDAAAGRRRRETFSIGRTRGRRAQTRRSCRRCCLALRPAFCGRRAPGRCSA